MRLLLLLLLIVVVVRMMMIVIVMMMMGIVVVSGRRAERQRREQCVDLMVMRIYGDRLLIMLLLLLMRQIVCIARSALRALDTRRGSRLAAAVWPALADLGELILRSDGGRRLAILEFGTRTSLQLLFTGGLLILFGGRRLHCCRYV